MLRSIGKAGGLTNSIIVDPIIINVGLIRKRRPSAKHKWILLDCFHRLCKINGHKPTRHLLISLLRRVVLLSTKIPEVFC